MNSTHSMLPIRLMAALLFAACGLAANARENADGAVIKYDHLVSSAPLDLLRSVVTSGWIEIDQA